ncbi:MAG: S8 family serine peptidase [Deltaproteobacteria bacterium]|nr:S8 family serine peptidase [Deltaproteobacteria bacterium]
MRVLKYILVFLFLMGFSLSHASVKVDPKLFEFAENLTNEQDTLRVLVLMDDKLDNSLLPNRYDKDEVIRFLKARTHNQWQQVENALQNTNQLGKSIVIRKIYWVNSSFSADVTPRGLKTLAYTMGIKKIYANRAVFPEDDINPPLPVELPYDLKQIKMDLVMKDYPDITGKNIIIGHLDTGIELNHPALANKVLVFFDNEKKIVAQAYDIQGHGTHTAGTIVGGDRTTNIFGMAPEASLVSSGPLGSYEGVLNGMEFFLQVGNENGGALFPRLINNSWNCEAAPDVELFYKGITAWEAAGILPVFSAGNSGPRPKSITTPHEHPSVLAVGSVGSAGLVSNFSSRGPGIFKGQETKKPDLSAPGENIRSSYLDGQYTSISGTSMATPHVTGAAALLWQTNPKLTPVQVREILTVTTEAVDINGASTTPGSWNANYGYGKLNVYEAIKMAIKTREINPQPEPLMPFGIGDTSRVLRFTSPDDIMAYSIVRMKPEPLIKTDFQYDQSFDGEGWVTPAEIWE